MPFEALAKKGGQEEEEGTMFYAYILRSQKDPTVFYYGYTTDLKTRLQVHNNGANPSTKAMRPWAIAWYGAFETEMLARNFERYLKTASGKAFARKRLLGTPPMNGFTAPT